MQAKIEISNSPSMRLNILISALQNALNSFSLLSANSNVDAAPKLGKYIVALTKLHNQCPRWLKELEELIPYYENPAVMSERQLLTPAGETKICFEKEGPLLLIANPGDNLPPIRDALQILFPSLSYLLEISNRPLIQKAFQTVTRGFSALLSNEKPGEDVFQAQDKIILEQLNRVQTIFSDYINCFDLLPDELLSYLFSFMNTLELSKLKTVSRQFSAAASENIKNTIKDHFSHKPYQNFQMAWEMEYKNLFPKQRSLFFLLKEGKSEQVIAQIKSVNDYGIKDINKMSLLDWARKLNNQAVLDHCFSFADSQDIYHESFFRQAIYCRQPLKLIQKIIEDKYININYLSAIALEDRPEVIDYFLTKVTVMNQADSYHLYLASHRGDTNLVRFLLRIPGIDVNKALGLFTPLEIAMYLNHTEIVMLLLEKPGIEMKDIGSCLYREAIRDHVGIVELLVKMPELENREWFDALYLATKHGQIDMVRALLSAPRNKVNKETKKYRLLSKAVSKGYAEIVKLLVEKLEIKVNEAGEQERMDLFLAVRKGNTEAVRILLSTLGVRANLTNRKGLTALHIAAIYGHYKVVELLLAHVDDIDSEALVKSLTLSSLMPSLSKHNHIKNFFLDQNGGFIETLLNLTARIDAYYDGIPEFTYNFTPLDLAVLYGHSQIVALLLAKRPALTNERNQKLIALAEILDYTDIIKQLQDKQVVEIQASDEHLIRPTLSYDDDLSDLLENNAQVGPVEDISLEPSETNQEEVMQLTDNQLATFERLHRQDLARDNPFGFFKQTKLADSDYGNSKTILDHAYEKKRVFGIDCGHNRTYRILRQMALINEEGGLVKNQI